MRGRLRQNDVAATFSRLSHLPTGQRRVLWGLNALKAACRLEDIVTQGLEQEPSNPGYNELRFHCPTGWHGHYDNNPSLWVNIEKQRWGCNACNVCSSGDVIDFLKKLHGFTTNEALAWLETWHYYHVGNGRVMKIRLRRKRAITVRVRRAS